MSEENAAVVDQKLVIERTQMVRIYQSALFKSADSWTNDQLVKRSTQLGEDDLSRMGSDEDKEMLDRIISANEHKEVFEVVGGKKSVTKNEEGDPMSENATATLEKPKKEKAPPKPKKEAAPKVSKVDRWNCRLGLPPADINAVMTEEFQEVKDIAKAAGVDEARVLYHFTENIKKGKDLAKALEKSEDGKWRFNMENLKGK